MNPFEKLARLGLVHKRRALGTVWTGRSDAVDCTMGEEWRRWSTSEALFGLWSPPAASPWSGYHRPTLFAALESVPERDRWPSPVNGFPPQASPREAPGWARPDTAIILDLPAPASVAWGAHLARRAGHEPVATFNNWPHERALVAMAPTLGALLFFAPWVHDAKENFPGARAPVLLLDSRRLGPRAPKPRDFDNRYFLLESDLPTAAMLRRAGMERVVYVGPSGATQETDDMNRYLHELTKRIPVQLAHVAPDAWTWGDALPYAPAIRKTPFNTVKDPAFRGFRRSAAGGFGELVPEPSSGSG